MMEMNQTPSIFEGATGEIVFSDPKAYQVEHVAGKNVTIGTAGSNKVINAVMNLLAGDNITVSEPDEDGQVTISSTGGSVEGGIPPGGTAGQILAKIDSSDYNTAWVNPPTGGGSGVMLTDSMSFGEIIPILNSDISSV